MVMMMVVASARPNIKVHARSVAVVLPVPVLPIPTVHQLHFVFTRGLQSIQSCNGGGLARHCDEAERDGTGRHNQPIAMSHRSFSLSFAGVPPAGVIYRRTASKLVRSNDDVHAFQAGGPTNNRPNIPFIQGSFTRAHDYVANQRRKHAYKTRSARGRGSRRGSRGLHCSGQRCTSAISAAKPEFPERGY